MMRMVSERVGRLAHVAALGLFAFSLVPAAGVNAAERPLDFGAALLMPAELEQFGFENYGIDTGRYVSFEQLLEEGGGFEADEEELEALGTESVHKLILHPMGGIEEHPGPDITIVSFIFVYEDEEHAELAYGVIEDESDIPTATDLDDAPQLGDESELTETFEEVEDRGEMYDLHSLDFSFRIGRVTAAVNVACWNEEVDRDAVEAMGALLEAKLLGVLNDGEVDGARTPGLDSVAPRYEGETITADRSHYCILNGEALAQSYSPGLQEFLQGWVEEYGFVADYCAQTRFWLGSGDAVDLRLNVEAMRFARADDAARFVADRLESATAAGSSYDDVDVIDVDPADLPFEADSVTAITFARDVNGTMMPATSLTVQVGRMVIYVAQTGYTTPELDVLIAVMADAFGCTENACYQTMEPPAALADFLDEQEEVLADR